MYRQAKRLQIRQRRQSIFSRQPTREEEISWPWILHLDWLEEEIHLREWISELFLFDARKVLGPFDETWKCTRSIIQELGPGQYPIQAPISARGTYYNSKYASSGCPKIGQDERFTVIKAEAPGPGKCKSLFIQTSGMRKWTWMEQGHILTPNTGAKRQTHLEGLRGRVQRNPTKLPTLAHSKLSITQLCVLRICSPE